MRSGIILFILVSLCTELAFGQSITNGLQLYYKFDGDAVDQTPNEFDGTINGPVAALDGALNPNGAYFFDGVNDFIDLPVDPLLKPDLPFSYTLKVKFESLQQNLTNMFTTDYQEDNYHGSWCELGGGGTGKVNLSFAGGLGGTGSGNRRTKSSEATVVAQKWYQLTFVVRGATDMEIYIDCVDAGGAYTGSGATQVAYSSTPGSIGRKDGDANGPSNYFNGTIDELAFWNRALSVAEVRSLCNNALGVEEATIEPNISVAVYPNPTSKEFVIDFKNPNNHNCEIQLVDMFGSIVYSETANSGKTTIDVLSEKLSSGLYICRVYDYSASMKIGATKLLIE